MPCLVAGSKPASQLFLNINHQTCETPVKKVYTLHGFAADFAQTLRELGYDAQALSQDEQFALALGQKMQARGPASQVKGRRPGIGSAAASNTPPAARITPAVLLAEGQLPVSHPFQAFALT